MNKEIQKILNQLSIPCHKYSVGLMLDDLRHSLTGDQIEIIKYKLDGLKNVEIAKEMGVCAATITVRMKVIKIKVKEYLK